MNSSSIYTKTPIGDEAVRQSTRVVQRNLRMVLVQIDGKLSVGELSAKIGNARLVESAIRDLEEGGFIVSADRATEALEAGRQAARRGQVSAISQFSSFGKPTRPADSVLPDSNVSQFSSFGKPVLPAARRIEKDDRQRLEREVPAAPSSGRSGRYFGIGLLVVLGLLLLGILMFPVDRYRPQIEAAASAALGIPVQVGKVGLVWSPSPQLVLSELRLGQTGRVDALRLHSPLGLWLKGEAGVGMVTVQGMNLPAETLAALPMLAGAEKALSLKGSVDIRLEGLSIQATPALRFGPFNGRIDLSDGSLKSAMLESPDRALLLKAMPAAGGRVDVSLEGRAWRMPGLPLTFDTLQAMVLVHEDRLEARAIDASVMGGVLQSASWTLSWRDGLAMKGSGELARLDMRKLASLLVPTLNIEGDLAGHLEIAGQAADWERLWNASRAQLDAEVTRGLFTGLDIGEAARRGGGAASSAGSTRFDRLKARVDIDRHGTSIRNLMLEAGLMTASGHLNAGPAGNLEGHLDVAVRSSISTLNLPIRVSGTLPNLRLQSGK